MNQFRNIPNIARRVVTGSLALLLIVSAPTPVFVYADEDCSPVAAAPSGIQAPTGSDAGTYTYNECTGLWENPHYTWSPATHVATPKEALVYTYNASTKKWDTGHWVFSPASGKWVQTTVSVDTPPSGARTIGGPVDETPAATADTPTSSGGGGADVNNSNATGVNSTTNASVNNQIDSNATSGNASTSSNTNAGSATSGGAQAIVNAINMLQSSSGFAGSTAATFTVNIDGDVQGDLVLDPGALQPALGSSSINTDNNLNLNIANNGQINNDITLAAQSGDASVNSNTNGGNATTGNAEAIVNVVNMLNSMIAANQSFLGTININGNFNGNILMPQQFLDSLIASNAPHETVAISQDTLSTLNANLSNSTDIDNNVKSSATTGSASVSGNTEAGTATSGNANANVTIFNLTNQKITGANTLLVFVNVTGKWIGVLMDAPTGTTAAAYGGGLTTNTTNTADITAANTGKITNNIDVAAASGNADVSNNTHAGSAKSGDAKTAVNVSNITNSSIDLTGWFGILFINVFGNWNGNFGVLQPQTSGGSPAAPVNSQGTPQVFGFNEASTTAANIHTSNHVGITNHINSTSQSGNASVSGNTTTTALGSDLSNVAAKVLGAHVAAPHIGSPQIKHDQNTALMVGGALFAAGLLLMVVEQVRSRRQEA